MTKYYSAETGGFYDSDIHKLIPDDAVYVAPSRHAELLEAQANGVSIVPSDLGNPIFSRPREISLPDRRYMLMSVIKAEARRRIEAVSPLWKQINDMRQHDGQAASRFSEIDRLRGVSDDLEAAVALFDDQAVQTFDPGLDKHWDARS